MNLLDLINLSLKIIGCSTTLSNHLDSTDSSHNFTQGYEMGLSLIHIEHSSVHTFDVTGE
jgi:hypothetical protein